MAKKHPRRLVIDADVASSASTSEYPDSSGCRQFLKTVLDVGHHVVITPKINREWRNHSSKYSMTWLRMMYEKGYVQDDDKGPNKSLRKRIEKTVPCDQRKAAAKDVHLIEAALDTDHLVASGDKQARRIFRCAAKSVCELKRIVWVNPKLPTDNAVCWLRDGAQSQKHRKLGA